MKEMTLSERLFNNVNTALSINFMILQNISKLLPNGNQTVFTSRDVFREKTYEETTYDFRFEEFAEIRRDFFKSIQNEFEAPEILGEFKQNCKTFIDAYNSVMKTKFSISDVFSERNVKDWAFFEQLFEDVEALSAQQNPSVLALRKTLGDFASFYDVYKDWLSAYELFEAIKGDLTESGSRSAYLGRPRNPDIFTLSFDDFHDNSLPIVEFIQERKKVLDEVSKDKTNDSEETNLYLKASERALNTLIDLFNRIQDRFGFANTHLLELDSFWTKLFYKLVYEKCDFKIEQVYIHKIEIVSLISALSTFPELDEHTQKISKAFLNKNVNFSENKTKENT